MNFLFFSAAVVIPQACIILHSLPKRIVEHQRVLRSLCVTPFFPDGCLGTESCVSLGSSVMNHHSVGPVARCSHVISHENMQQMQRLLQFEHITSKCAMAAVGEQQVPNTTLTVSLLIPLWVFIFCFFGYFFLQSSQS